MKLKSLFLLFGLLPLSLAAQWLPVGKADYNWGPFLVYSLNLSSETGNYTENERPLMLTFVFDKQVEGKNFAVTLIKEINGLNSELDTELWLKELLRIFPDFSPKDKLSFIALEDKGYFVRNDTVLDYEFQPDFNQALINVWLATNTNFPKIREKLLDKSQIKAEEKSENELKSEPNNTPLLEDEINPQLPPEYPLANPEQSVS